MKAYKGVDFYAVDDLFSDEERLIRDSVRSFVSEKVLPEITVYHREGKFPVKLIKPMAELGILGVNLPQEYGCAGSNNIAYGLVCRELERGDSGIRSFVSVQGSLVMWPIFSFGSEEQKKKWLPLMAQGKAVGCFGLTEPDHGSDPMGMTTTAKLDGNEWVLNGSKMWITNGSIADVAVVWAKTDEEIKGFLVEKDTSGFSTNEIKGKLSLRASDTAELVFEECRIPKDNVLPGSSGIKSPLSCLTQARYGIAWGAIGSAMACYDEAVNYSAERIQFGKPLASFQLVQRKLVKMLSGITKAQLLAHRIGTLKDENKVTAEQVSLAKKENVKMALETARMTRDILGAAGITDEHQAMRHMANLESVYTYEGTNDIHTLIIGKHITGIDAFS
ncbi:MAG: acyl-CoA dehydrogenase family protein [Candidatus Marinimicrobia bacterium]|nr:acyl-CoA dehydrogenase family protein [Candidatus Neomarinimicrobiota bacterium]